MCVEYLGNRLYRGEPCQIQSWLLNLLIVQTYAHYSTSLYLSLFIHKMVIIDIYPVEIFKKLSQ